MECYRSVVLVIRYAWGEPIMELSSIETPPGADAQNDARREVLAKIGRFAYVAPALVLLTEPKQAHATYGRGEKKHSDRGEKKYSWRNWDKKRKLGGRHGLLKKLANAGGGRKHW